MCLKLNSCCFYRSVNKMCGKWEFVKKIEVYMCHSIGGSFSKSVVVVAKDNL